MAHVAQNTQIHIEPERGKLPFPRATPKASADASRRNSNGKGGIGARDARAGAEDGEGPPAAASITTVERPGRAGACSRSSTQGYQPHERSSPDGYVASDGDISKADVQAQRQAETNEIGDLDTEETIKRTCTNCRRSKVKCTRSFPCARCMRLNLACVAQTRGRGRPAASHKKAKLQSAPSPISMSTHPTRDDDGILPSSLGVSLAPARLTPEERCSVPDHTSGFGLDRGRHRSIENVNNDDSSSSSCSSGGSSSNTTSNTATTTSNTNSAAATTTTTTATDLPPLMGDGCGTAALVPPVSYSTDPNDYLTGPHPTLLHLHGQQLDAFDHSRAFPPLAPPPVTAQTQASPLLLSARGWMSQSMPGAANTPAGGSAPLGMADRPWQNHLNHLLAGDGGLSNVGSGSARHNPAAASSEAFIGGGVQLLPSTTRIGGVTVPPSRGGDIFLSAGANQSSRNGDAIDGGRTARGTDEVGGVMDEDCTAEANACTAEANACTTGDKGACDSRRNRSLLPADWGPGNASRTQGLSTSARETTSGTHSAAVSIAWASGIDGSRGSVCGPDVEEGRPNGSREACGGGEMHKPVMSARWIGGEAVLGDPHGEQASQTNVPMTSSVAWSAEGANGAAAGDHFPDRFAAGITAEASYGPFAGSSASKTTTMTTTTMTAPAIEQWPGEDPADVMVRGFWRLYDRQQIDRPKAVVVIRHFVLCALEKRSTTMLNKTVNMAKALGVNAGEILNDYSIYTMFHDLLRGAGAGHAASPEPRVPFDTNVEVAPYVRALESEVAAVSFRVYERGRSCYKNNDMWCGLFMSSERANELHAANKEVWMTCIHPVDQRRFLELWSLRLFSVRENQAESVYILNCRDRRKVPFLALVLVRYEFRNGGDYAAYGISIHPLPRSPYLRDIHSPSVSPASRTDDPPKAQLVQDLQLPWPHPARDQISEGSSAVRPEHAPQLREAWQAGDHTPLNFAAVAARRAQLPLPQVKGGTRSFEAGAWAAGMPLVKQEDGPCGHLLHRDGQACLPANGCATGVFDLQQGAGFMFGGQRMGSLGAAVNHREQSWDETRASCDKVMGAGNGLRQENTDLASTAGESTTRQALNVSSGEEGLSDHGMS